MKASTTPGGKAKYFAVTVTADEHKLLTRKARKMGMTVSRLIRQCLGLEGI